MEIWKDIPTWEGYYQVSNLGRVKSLPRKIEGKFGGLRKELILRETSRGGYRNVHLRKKGISTSPVGVHRLVCMAFLENPENKPNVNHKNGLRSDNRLENLEWCTQSENIAHMYRVLGHSVWNKGKRLHENKHITFKNGN